MAEYRRRMTYEEQRSQREAAGQQRMSRYSDYSDYSGYSSYSDNRSASTRVRGSQQVDYPESNGRRTTRSTSSGAAARYDRQRYSRESNGRAQTSRTRTARSQSNRAQMARSGSGAAIAAERSITKLPIVKIAVVVVALIVVIFAVQMCTSAAPITVSVNGTSFSIRGAKNMETAIRESGLPVNPGDLISLQGNIITKSAGHPFSATVNGEETVDPEYKLRDGDSITVTDGQDIVEEYDAVEQTIPFSATDVGTGSLHVFSPGTEGIIEVRTGKMSGEVVEKQTVDPVDMTCTRYNPDVGNDKVIAITFDDGPLKEFTDEILDILAKNDVKATFFVVGTEVAENPSSLKRAYDEGHLICTHTYDHARPAGSLSITSMTADEQVQEIEQGRQAISDVTGAEASRIVRLPGGNMDANTANNIYEHVDAEIGWTVDSADWTKPGADAIYETLMASKPGDIILCHDGGGDRSQTVEAVKKAIPDLKEKGFTFVTVDKMLEYPSK